METAQTNTKKLILFNASALKFTDCERKIYWNILQGYTQPLTNNDTWYGSCFHEFMRLLSITGNFIIAMQSAEKMFRDKVVHVKSKKEYLDVTHLRKTCLAAYDHFSKGDDFEILKAETDCPFCKGKRFTIDKDAHGNDYKIECKKCVNGKGVFPLVELQFHIPYYSDDEVEVLLVGTEDKLGKFRGGCYSVGDYKTTATWDTKSYLENYALSPQLMFYVLLLKLMARQYPDSIYAEITKHKVGAFIDGVFLSSTKDTVFKRSEVFFYSDELLNEFEVMLRLKVMKVVDVYIGTRHVDSEPNLMPIREGLMTQTCIHNFGNRCPFFTACSAPDNVIVGHVLKNNFIQKEYGMDTYGGVE